MTNEDVKNGFNEVYNQFWNKYKNDIPNKDSEEWDKMHDWVLALRRKYPFLAETVAELECELDQRGRRGEVSGSVSGSVTR